MNTEKRTVVLFGAGAAIPWGAPCTKYLTDLVKDSAPSFLCIDGQTKVVEFLNDAFKKSGIPESKINFESIINVIEELIVHYSYFDENHKLPSISKILFSSRFENAFLNFSIGGGIENHGYSLEIPKEKEYPFSKISLNNESSEQFYFQHLLSVLLTNINAQISKYSYHTKGNSVINKKAELNQSFQKWYKSISEKTLVRMYTLNYDRLFKILVEQIGISVFEGFECGEFVESENISPDISRILLDMHSPVHYNLHGSAFWEVHSRDEHSQLNNLWISLRSRPVLEMNNSESPLIQIDKGKNILVSNIITGYQKTQKSSITPYKQLQAAFDRDCFLADELLIIGYSFGDYHINSSIISALRYNIKLKLHFIDPIYSDKESNAGYDLLVKRMIHTLPGIIPKDFNPREMQPVYSNDRNTCTYFDGKLTVSMIKFDQYLSQQNL